MPFVPRGAPRVPRRAAAGICRFTRHWFQDDFFDFLRFLGNVEQVRKWLKIVNFEHQFWFIEWKSNDISRESRFSMFLKYSAPQANIFCRTKWCFWLKTPFFAFVGQVGHYLTPKCQNPTLFEKYQLLELKRFWDKNVQSYLKEQILSFSGSFHRSL